MLRLLLRAYPKSFRERHGDEDRKSTRLNSSHSQISYAVFCLKKKNLRHALSTLGFISMLEIAPLATFAAVNVPTRRLVPFHRVLCPLHPPTCPILLLTSVTTI